MNTIQKCYSTHQPLLLSKGELHGGSCSMPVTNMDVYVGLDAHMRIHTRAYPWVGEAVSVHYLITDMAAPHDHASFIKLVDWIVSCLVAGKKVHVGCIGGHGRTGTVLAAVVSIMLGERDAISYVRKHYCKKAVESKVQVDFLVKHFGVLSVLGAKEFKSQQYYPTIASVTSISPKAKKGVVVEHIPDVNNLWHTDIQ